MPSKASARWLSEADVTSLLDINTAITALEHGLRLETRGEAANMMKTHVAWSGGNLHAIGATFTGPASPAQRPGRTVTGRTSSQSASS